jgi:hypothetical protein
MRSNLSVTDKECIKGVFDLNDVLQRREAEPVRHGRWVDNHCTECGEMPMGTEVWESIGIEPPRFERFMDFCPCCGAKMDGGGDE